MTGKRTAKKILIIEDEIALQHVLRDKLREAGYDVLIASDGEEGLVLALAEHPNLILLDIVMPKVGGLAMLRTLRADVWGKNAHVFILTNVHGSDEKSESINQHVAKYFVKSDINLEDLLWSVKMYA
jgi:DNA-binding response OmpR family regulator